MVDMCVCCTRPLTLLLQVLKSLPLDNLPMVAFNTHYFAMMKMLIKLLNALVQYQPISTKKKSHENMPGPVTHTKQKGTGLKDNFESCLW